MTLRRPAAAVLMMLALVSPSVLSSPHQNNGSIAGTVVNERQQPVAGALVQAFPADVMPAPAEARGTAPRLLRGSGSASTDAEGRFRIAGLASGDYIIAAEPAPSLPSGGPAPELIYATTFYPSTIDDRQATRVSALGEAGTTIQIELLRVRGARISGSVVSPSGRSTDGMSVRLYRRFGDFGAESPVATVDRGMFTTPRVPPGWYQVTVGTRPQDGADGQAEFADTVIEVDDRDRDGLSLVLGHGASISGRVTAEAGASAVNPIGLRISASPTPGQFSGSRAITARVGDNWAFRMTGLSGSYEFAASTDRAPQVVAKRITVDGVEKPAGAGVELTDGAHEVVVFVALREPPRPTFDRTLTLGALVEQFKSDKVFWRQLSIAMEIADRRDGSVLPGLESWLTHEDRHLRGNAAFIFARLGDSRGFQAITEILTDRSGRPPGSTASAKWSLQAQIREDRYYAVHLLGNLRDPRAVPILIPLLQDKELDYAVPWALGEIGDRSAIAPLIDALDNPNPSVRVYTIYALETLRAKEAIPKLTSLLNDEARSNLGTAATVAEAAKAAIARLQ